MCIAKVPAFCSVVNDTIKVRYIHNLNNFILAFYLHFVQDSVHYHKSNKHLVKQ